MTKYTANHEGVIYSTESKRAVSVAVLHRSVADGVATAWKATYWAKDKANALRAYSPVSYSNGKRYETIVIPARKVI